MTVLVAVIIMPGMMNTVTKMVIL